MRAFCLESGSLTRSGTGALEDHVATCRGDSGYYARASRIKFHSFVVCFEALRIAAKW